MVGLGHITSVTSQDLHRNCGKRCGKDQRSGRKRPMNPHVPAVCTIMVRDCRARLHDANLAKRHIISEGSLRLSSCTSSSPINSLPPPSNCCPPFTGWTVDARAGRTPDVLGPRSRRGRRARSFAAPRRSTEALHGAGAEASGDCPRRNRHRQRRPPGRERARDPRHERARRQQRQRRRARAGA